MTNVTNPHIGNVKIGELHTTHSIKTKRTYLPKDDIHKGIKKLTRPWQALATILYRSVQKHCRVSTSITL